MRSPNGYGSVIKLSGKRRRPFMVRVTKGWSEDRKQEFQVLGYFEKRTDAIQFLADYNRAPFNLDYAKVTFREVYDLWSKDAFQKMKDNVASIHRSTYNAHCSALYDVPYRQIRQHDFQNVIDSCPRGYSIKCAIRNLFKHMDAWAYDRDIIYKMYSVNLDVGESPVTSDRSVYTDEEVRKLLKLVGDPYVDETLVQLYTGFRISEVLSLTKSNIDLDQQIITAGGKTKAGTNRIVPIHPDILPIITAHLNEGKLFPHTGTQQNHLMRRKNALAALGFDHTSHDCRHTFRSKLDSAGANKVAIDLLMGHKSSDVGERVYTHKTIEELRAAINLLRFSA